MRGVIVFCILIALPALAAFGHDAYLAYDTHHPKTLEEFWDVFSLSDFGWLIHNYERDKFYTLEGYVKDGTFTEETMRYLISLKAFHVGLGVAGVCYLYLIIAFLYGIWPFKSLIEGSLSSSSDSFSRSNRSRTDKFKYNRK